MAYNKKLDEFLNNWANFLEHKESLDNRTMLNGKPNHITEFGLGYQDAVRDVVSKIEILKEENKILDPIFISSQEANKVRLAQKNKEILELKRTIANQKDLITNIPEILAKRIRIKDVDCSNTILQDIFKEFCDDMDKHGVSYDIKKLKLRIESGKKRLFNLQKKLSDSENIDALEKDSDYTEGEKDED